jgi:hypothetical protein
VSLPFLQRFSERGSLERHRGLIYYRSRFVPVAALTMFWPVAVWPAMNWYEERS